MCFIDPTFALNIYLFFDIESINCLKSLHRSNVVLRTQLICFASKLFAEYFLKN